MAKPCNTFYQSGENKGTNTICANCGNILHDHNCIVSIVNDIIHTPQCYQGDKCKCGLSVRDHLRIGKSCPETKCIGYAPNKQLICSRCGKNGASHMYQIETPRIDKKSFHGACKFFTGPKNGKKCEKCQKSIEEHVQQRKINNELVNLFEIK